jgi:hypothetical protein
MVIANGLPDPLFLDLSLQPETVSAVIHAINTTAFLKISFRIYAPLQISFQLLPQQNLKKEKNSQKLSLFPKCKL